MYCDIVADINVCLTTANAVSATYKLTNNINIIYTLTTLTILIHLLIVLAVHQVW